MKARNVTTQDIVEAVYSLNDIKYDGNIVLQNIGHASKNIVSFKVGARDSREAGTRRSASGRHGKWVCTHVFEDIMREIVERGGEVIIPGRSPGNPDRHQRVIRNDFELDNWVDAYNCSNIGSMVEEVYPEQVCNHCN